MKSFQFSIRVYIKATRITPFTMPRDGIYTCNWSETGICHFQGIENGYAELHSKLDEYFHMDQVIEDNLVEYYDRLAETLMGIGSQRDFETALLHSSQTYSPFSLVVKVNAPRREEHWYNGEAVSFSKSWTVAKPKFGCIRSWLMNIQQEGAVCKDISETCSYSERAFLYSQFHKGPNLSTNQNEVPPNLHQSNSPKRSLTSIKPVQLELLEENSLQQKMLNEKMMMDPVISLVLFNEYIPLRQPKMSVESKAGDKAEEGGLCKKMDGLFLGKSTETKPEIKAGGLFIRSEPSAAKAQTKSSSGGLFIRSEDSTSSLASDDWVIT